MIDEDTPIGRAIKTYSQRNPKKPIILRHKTNGTMIQFKTHKIDESVLEEGSVTSSKVTGELEKKGLDGNGRFDKVGQAITAADEVLRKFGMTTDAVSADEIRGNKGSRNLTIYWNPKKSDQDPIEVKKADLHVSWERMSNSKFPSESGKKYEVVAYLTGNPEKSPF